jgi:hypothetical protein
VAALAAPPFAASAAYGNFASPFVFLVRLRRTPLAILKFYLFFPRLGEELPKSEKEFLLLKNSLQLFYTDNGLNLPRNF